MDYVTTILPMLLFICMVVGILCCFNCYREKRKKKPELELLNE